MYRYDPYSRPYCGYYGRYGCGYPYGYPGYGYPSYANIYTPYSPLPYLLPSNTLPYYLQQPALPPPPPTPSQIAYSTNYSY